jgi:hypothetical protein
MTDFQFLNCKCPKIYITYFKMLQRFTFFIFDSIQKKNFFFFVIKKKIKNLLNGACGGQLLNGKSFFIFKF